ncbi:putative Hsp70 family chaperone Lhs1/Orp150 [Phyllosticta citriasiana]|uniref:putative Hsp70 family chaperone Lhs1/Orp150 n=1 Tax=Phyllosticta citriasiana TaxID=595635 RepID=UPI0030FDB6D0
MAPPGRRRAGTLPLMLALVCLLISTASAASAVLGIDLGTSYLKGVLVKPGIPLEIVLSKDSKRKESAAVAFKTPPQPFSSTGSAFPERAYGSNALALHSRFPADTFPNLKPLLGQRIFRGIKILADYKLWHPSLDMVGLKNRWTVGFRSPSFDEMQRPFSVEELLAMELQHLRENAEELAGKGSRITDAVITVPAFYSAAEKRAVEVAANLAGLKVLCLLSDGLAVGLNYATSRTFPSVSEGAKPEYHMVFDMGAGSTTATVLRFQGRTVKDVGRFNKTVQEVQVMGTGWDQTLGGDELNELIYDDIIQQFTEDPAAKKAGAVDFVVRRNGKIAARLWKDAEKIRQVLSANQATSSTYESLYEDVDFKYKITRRQFEEMASEHADRVQAPVKQALENANLTFADLDSIILHGGAVRTPFVQKALETLAGDASKLRSNVNADEAAVFGAAFKGAGLSPSFRVKEIRDIDVANHPVALLYIDPDGEHHPKLFTPTSKIGTTKEVPFKVQEDFDFVVYQRIAEIKEHPVFDVSTGNLTETVTELVEKEGCVKEEIVTQVSIKLDAVLGLAEVVGAKATCEVDEKKGSVVDGVKDFFGFGSKDGKQEPLKEGEEDQVTEKVTPTPETSSSATSTPLDASPLNDASKKPEEAKAPKKKTVSRNVSLNILLSGYFEFPDEDMKAMKDRLSAFDASDRARLAREAALNELEAFTYRSRDLLEDEGFIGASTKEQRTAIETKLRELSDWLSAEGADADEKTLKAKHADLKALISPIVSRQDEAKQRPEAISKLQELLSSSKDVMEMIKSSVDKVAAAEAAAAAASSSSSTGTPTPSPSSTPVEHSINYSNTPGSKPPAASNTPAASDSLDDLEEDLPPPPPPADDAAKKANSDMASSPYTAEDLTFLSAKYDRITAWLETKLAEQAKRSPTDEPALSAKDLEAKHKELSDAIVELAQRQLRGGAKKGAGGGKKSGGNGGNGKKNKTAAAKKKDEKKKKAEAEKEKEKEGEAKKKGNGNGGETPEHSEL